MLILFFNKYLNKQLIKYTIMIKKIIKLLLLLTSLFGNSNSEIVQKRYLSKAYKEGNNLFIHQNYCNDINDIHCNRIIKVNLRDNSKKSKQYYKIDNEILKDFKDIDLDRLLN